MSLVLMSFFQSIWLYEPSTSNCLNVQLWSLTFSINLIFSFLKNPTNGPKIKEYFSEKSRIENGVAQVQF